MIVLLSPAKTLDYDNPGAEKYTMPRFLEESDQLVDVMKKKDVKELQGLMKISRQLASLNVSRFRNWELPLTTDNAKQSVLAFKGDVYQGLEAGDFDAAELEFAQQHLRILSGLYGLLRPLDLMYPYRLEMGTKLKFNGFGSLYEFWGDKITEQINADLAETGSDAVINLASNEYFKVVKTDKLKGQLYDIQFKEFRDGNYRIISFSAKRARGYMSNYIVKNKISDPNDLKGFDMRDYAFNEELSSDFEWVFTR
jgi:cytoplasmic iron level regulating protein YaaA (DUF328/UPF0246 family)